jgi:hypothetical protein
MMQISFSGTVSIRDATHAQLLEKINQFTELTGRSPKITVCPYGKTTFYPVSEVLDSGLLYNVQHLVRRENPVDGVYDSVSLF